MLKIIYNTAMGCFQCACLKRVVKTPLESVDRTMVISKEYKKTLLSQGNRAMPQLFFSV